MFNKIKTEIHLANGNRLILVDKLAKECIYSECARNVVLVDTNGDIIWQVQSNFDQDGDPFTGIWLQDDGSIRAYRWDGGDYAIDMQTGFATPLLLVR